MKPVKYITVIDAEGATMGYGGPFVPVSHRFAWTGSGAIGAESLMRLFPSESVALSYFSRFVNAQSGTYERFTWSVE